MYKHFNSGLFQVPGTCTAAQPSYGGAASGACRIVTRQQCQPIQRNICRQVRTMLPIVSLSDVRCHQSSVRLFHGKIVSQPLGRCVTLCQDNSATRCQDSSAQTSLDNNALLCQEKFVKMCQNRTVSKCQNRTV